MFKITHVVGARPNFMKVAPVIRALASRAAELDVTVEQRLVHTGQHYSPEMSDLFFNELGLPEPDVNLEIGGGTHGENTGRVLIEFEKYLMANPCDAVLVVGDVNSTIACALAAKKLGISVIHVESGLRSYDMAMPEEINRILTDRISDLLYVSEPSGMDNLRGEGADMSTVHLVGNVMIDSLLAHKAKALAKPTLRTLSLEPGTYGLVTLHRPSNVDEEAGFRTIADALEQLSGEIPLVFPVHPRTRAKIDAFSLQGAFANVKLLDPLGYLDFVNCMANARLVLTDSGGIQEETTILEVPCLTLRENTERPATITDGTNQLVALDTRSIVDTVRNNIDNTPTGRRPELWDGQASQRIADHLLQTYTR